MVTRNRSFQAFLDISAGRKWSIASYSPQNGRCHNIQFVSILLQEMLVD
jgi:hypothetical protein